MAPMPSDLWPRATPPQLYIVHPLPPTQEEMLSRPLLSPLAFGKTSVAISSTFTMLSGYWDLRRLQALPHHWSPRLISRVVVLLGPLLTPQKGFWPSAPSRAKPDAVESIAGSKGRRPFTRSKSLFCGRSPAVLPTIQGGGSTLGDTGHSHSAR